MMKIVAVSKRQLFHKGRRGNAIVLLIVFLVGLIGFAALTIDMGTAYVQRTKIQVATDLTSLAAVVDWASGAGAAAAITVGNDFGQTNGLKLTEFTVDTGLWHNDTHTFEHQNMLPATFPANTVPAVKVSASRVVPTPLARIVGTSSLTPRVSSVAVAGRALGGSGAVPWATCASFVNENKCTLVNLQFGQSSTGTTNDCSTGSGGNSGNFGQLDLTGGGNDYRSLIENGYSGVLRVGDCVQTDPGASWGQTRQGIDARLLGQDPYICTATSLPPTGGRYIIVPRVNTLDVNGASTRVCVTGFYVMALEGYNNSSKTVDAKFIQAFSGQGVDPGTPCEAGALCAVGLVQ